MVKCDDNYSFRLSVDDSAYSDTGSVTSSYKERIDSLFRGRRHTVSGQKPMVTTVQVHSPSDNTPTTPLSSAAPLSASAKTHTPVITSKSTPLVTSIHVSPPQVWKTKTPTPKEELETIFGGKDQRQQAFHDVRTAVQAQIEKLFADAAAEPSIPGVRSIAPKASPCFLPLAQPPLPPPPPLPTNGPPPLPKNPPPPLPVSSHLSVPTPQASSPSPSVTPSLSDRQSVSSACSSPAPSQLTEVALRKVVSNMKYGVDYLGAIQLADKASNLEVLQEPLKELYYKYRNSISKGRRPVPGALHIAENGIRIIHGTKTMPGYYELFNPFPTIAVWAAVKLVIRREVGEHGQMFFSYAFLPLICDPEAQDKYNLYHELNVGNPNVMAGEHPPMFACVMRKVGVPKVLECHGFVCRSAEDAIVIAANLYQSLLENMRGGHMSDSTCSDSREEDRRIMSDSEVPVRPPRKKRSRNSELSSSRRLKRSSSEDILRSHNLSSEHKISKRKIKRSVSDRHSLAALDDIELYTKVTLPRSKSFASVSSTYDFKDLLQDVKKETGLKSVDDVLKQVIRPKGMSFSEMDPKYRELLLKLALTLSKDEIYQRSKNIMKKYKYRTTSIASIIDSDSEGSTISSVLRATKRSLSRIGSRASSLQNTKKPLALKIKYNSKNNMAAKLPESKPKEICSHLVDGTNKKVLPKTPMPKRVPGRVSDGYGSCNECGYDSECSSKCYCSLPRPQNQNRPPILPASKQLTKMSENGHHIDSTCECDTESCAESEKCYCSLKRVKKSGIKMYEINLDSETNTDTDTTIKSATTYNSCSYGSRCSNRQRNAFPHLPADNRRCSARGSVFTVHPDAIRKKSLSCAFSSDSDSSDRRQDDRVSADQKMFIHRQRSASNEFLSEKSRRRHPSGSVGSGGSHDSQESTESRSSIGSLINEGSHRSRSSSGSHQKILLVSAVDPSGKVVYRGASQKPRQEGSDTASIMSMKKTAEIAALFSELKLSQTTDLITQLQHSASESEDDAYSSMQATNSFLFSDDIEQSLGYLP